ncbi:MAG: threonine/serine exporter family protein [Clostridia bacterium]|nr:threonine/serine exporter family protein [Clostridia bacterium]
MEYVIMGLCSAVGTAFFALSVRSSLKTGIIAGCLGGVGYALYIILIEYMSASGAVFIATLVACLGAEFVARIIKTPATVLSIPAIISLVPGISLYKTMISFGAGDNSAGVNRAVATLVIAGSMSLAVTLATLAAKMFFKKHHIK